MRILLLLLLLCAVTGQMHGETVCKRKITIAVDVSGSVAKSVTDEARETRALSPDQFKAALKNALKMYLFRDMHSCLAVFTFATQAQLLMDYTPVGSAAGRDSLLKAIDDLKFETAHPEYYTNWEAAFKTVLDHAPLGTAEGNARRSAWLYLVTDGLPTTRTTGCVYPDDEPCDGVTANLDAAVIASKSLQQSGTGVVGVGLGHSVTDEALIAISGPCDAVLGCRKNWNYFHSLAYEDVERSLGDSFGQHLELAAPILSSTSSQSTTTHPPSKDLPAATTTSRNIPPPSQTSSPMSHPQSSTTRSSKPAHTTLIQVKAGSSSSSSSTTTTTKATTKPTTTSPQVQKKHTTWATVTPEPDDLGPTEVHNNTWVFAVVIGCICGAALIILIIVVCVCARHEPRSVYGPYANSEARIAQPLAPEMIATTAYRPQTFRLVQDVKKR